MDDRRPPRAGGPPPRGVVRPGRHGDVDRARRPVCRCRPVASDVDAGPGVGRDDRCREPGQPSCRRRPTSARGIGRCLTRRLGDGFDGLLERATPRSPSRSRSPSTAPAVDGPRRPARPPLKRSRRKATIARSASSAAAARGSASAGWGMPSRRPIGQVSGRRRLNECGLGRSQHPSGDRVGHDPRCAEGAEGALAGAHAQARPATNVVQAARPALGEEPVERPPRDELALADQRGVPAALGLVLGEPIAKPVVLASGAPGRARVPPRWCTAHRTPSLAATRSAVCSAIRRWVVSLPPTIETKFVDAVASLVVDDGVGARDLSIVSGVLARACRLRRVVQRPNPGVGAEQSHPAQVREELLALADQRRRSRAPRPRSGRDPRSGRRSSRGSPRCGPGP